MYTISTKRQLPVISQINILILPLTFHPYLVIGALYSSILDINTIKKKIKKNTTLSELFQNPIAGKHKSFNTKLHYR
jgi:hypothetical protein